MQERVEELKSHTTQVLYGGIGRKRGIEDLKSHTLHIWVVYMDVSKVRTLKTTFSKSQIVVVAMAR